MRAIAYARLAEQESTELARFMTLFPGQRGQQYRDDLWRTYVRLRASVEALELHIREMQAEEANDVQT